MIEEWMIQYPYCQVITQGDACFNVAGPHYEQLRDMLDQKQKGWVELEMLHDSAARVMVRLEDLENIIYVTEEFDKARNESSVTNL